MPNNYEIGDKYKGGNPEFITVIANHGSGLVKALTLSITLSASGVAYTSCSEPYTTHNEIVEDKEAPKLDIWEPLTYIKGDEQFNIGDNYLEIGNITVANRRDNTGVRSVTIEQDGEIVNNGDFVRTDLESYTVTIKVFDNRGNRTEGKVCIEKELQGLDDLRRMNMVVGQEVNLLEGIKYRGKSAEDLYKDRKLKVEIDGEELKDPTKYIPPQVGSITIKYYFDDGNNKTEYEITKNVNAAEFEEPELNKITEADILGDYPFYENLGTTKRKDFVRPDILASYIAKSRGSESVSHIMTGEDPNSGDNARHAKNGTEIIGYFSGANVEYINGVNKKNRELTEERVKNDPEKYFVISCADDRILGETKEKFKEKEEVKALKRLLKYKNVIVVNAIGNRTNQMWQTLNENSDPTGNPHDGKVCYNSSSANTEPGFYNKFTVLGFDPSSANPYLLGKKGTCSNISCLPVGYNKENGNVVIFYIDTNDTGNTDSSYATAAINGVLTNLLQLYMTNHPESDAKQFGEILAKYLIPKELLCTDENGQVVNSGEVGYIIDTQKFLECEIWHCEEISNLDFNSDIVSLPYSKGIYYFGCPGFEYLDRETLERKESKELKNPNDAMAWRRNRETYGKYSNGNNLSIEFNVGQVTPKFDLILPSVKTYMKTISPLTEFNGISHEIRKSYYENAQTLTAEQLSTTFYNGYKNSNIPSNNNKILRSQTS